MLFLISSVSAATLHGEIYNLDLEKVENVLVEINTVPKQQLLAKNGEYSFEIQEGDYVLKAYKNELAAEEKIKVIGNGDFVFDLFLFPSFEGEDTFLSELNYIEIEEEKEGFAKYPLYSYLIALGILLIAIGRIILAKRRYKKTGKKEEVVDKSEEKETGEEDIKKESEQGDLDKAIELIKQHDGRITQKELRKEMIYLSEAKISLILTELEHKGEIEKIKKGRGNVVILKN
jgi:uncharacterized membrane protein